MAGITNGLTRERRNQQRVEERKRQVPPGDAPPHRQQHRDQNDQPEERGRLNETGAGRGPEYSGH